MSEAKFKIAYKPEGVDEPRSWEVDVMDGLKASEMIALKHASGGSIKGINPLMDGLAQVDMEAVKGLLWILMKRDLSTLPWESLDFTLSEIEIERLTDETPGQLRTRLEAMQAADNLAPAGQETLRRLVAAGIEPEPEDPKA